MSKNAIEVRNLTKKYDDFEINNMCFDIPEGSIVGFIGENGAGKSTTMRAILGLVPTEAGKIRVLDHPVGKDSADENWREQISVVFDECNFPNELKVKNINIIMKNIYRTWNENLFKEYLQKFELPVNKKVRELSKGMKMKLSIAAALSHDSKLLILDEATSGLDPVVRNEILDIFREYVEDENHTVFLSSHITSDIEKVADYIILIHKGNLLLMESKDKLLYEYGMVKCTKEQADKIPTGIIVGREDSSFGTSVLVRDRQSLKENGFVDRHARDIQQPVIDRVGIEDILLYIAKNQKIS
ncbi:MAG: ABC transporter ATP-binding protein [Lachnospiraceae bacterium]|nr:ABC transporter ATP-binding protein [Lachnospiraceae bacterium]